MDPSVSSTGNGEGFVSVDEVIPKKCVRTRGRDQCEASLIHCSKLEDLGEKLLICVINRWWNFDDRSIINNGLKDSEECSRRCYKAHYFLPPTLNKVVIISLFLVTETYRATERCLIADT